MTMAAGQKTLAEAFPGRFLLGLGVSHGHLVAGVRKHDYSKPYSYMVQYLDRMDKALFMARGPEDDGGRLLAALGPKMLELSATRANGSHPYFTTPEHTAIARETMGPDALLAPEQMVVLETDPVEARRIARAGMKIYLGLPNYFNNLMRLGFTEDDRVDGAATAWSTRSWPGAPRSRSPHASPSTTRPAPTTCVCRCCRTARRCPRRSGVASPPPSSADRHPPGLSPDGQELVSGCSRTRWKCRYPTRERAGRAASAVGRRRSAVDRRLLHGSIALLAGLVVSAAPAGVAIAAPPSSTTTTEPAPTTTESAPTTTESAPTTTEPAPSTTAAPTTSEAVPPSTDPAPSTSDAATSAPVPPGADQASSGPVSGATSSRPSVRPSTGATDRPATAPASPVAAPAAAPSAVGGVGGVGGVDVAAAAPRPAGVPAAGQVATGAIGQPAAGPVTRPSGIPNVFTIAETVSQWKLLLLIAVMSGLGAALLVHLGRRDQAAMDAIHLDLMLGLERESPEPPIR